jgi:hypothetical protein
MPWPDYIGPLKPNKGYEGGACNRELCQDEPADWYNHGSGRWYCEPCRRTIQFDSFNLGDWQLTWEPKKGHPMFETRAMMDTREKAAADSKETN